MKYLLFAVLALVGGAFGLGLTESEAAVPDDAGISLNQNTWQAFWGEKAQFEADCSPVDLAAAYEADGRQLVVGSGQSFVGVPAGGEFFVIPYAYCVPTIVQIAIANYPGVYGDAFGP